MPIKQVTGERMPWSTEHWGRGLVAKQVWTKDLRSGQLVTRPWVRATLRRAAIRYARHGWPVIPGAFLIHDRYLCGPLCPTVGCHPAIDDWQRQATVDPATIAGWWADTPYSVLLATGHAFDVIDVPARLGRPACQLLGAGGDARPGASAASGASAGAGPVAETRTGRWMFLVSPRGRLRAELAGQLDVVIHGEQSWIPAPPTRSPAGPIRWVVSPAAAAWRLPDSRLVQRALVVALSRSGRAPTFATTTRALTDAI
jgi:Bifunctional DNA primase/polymerase, N-terminal